MVIDPTRDGSYDTSFTRAQVAAMQNGAGGEKLLGAHISIGEVNDFQDEWHKNWTTTGTADGALTANAPDWLGPVNPDWPEGRKVRYWDTDWQKIIFNDQGTGSLDRLVKQGFDAAYLDIVDAYYFWSEEVKNADRLPGDPAKGDEKDAAQRMIDFIVDMTAHARETNPDFFVVPQNGELLIDALQGTDPARKTAFLDAIGGVAVEDIYFPGEKDENNTFAPDEYRIRYLQRDFLANGKFVVAVDYINDSSKLEKFILASVEDGFVPYAAPTRNLDKLGEPLASSAASAGDDVWLGNTGSDTFDAGAGADILNGMYGADSLLGGTGADWLFGFWGRDRLLGQTGEDHLSGGAGNDRLRGGYGADTFIFEKGTGRDTVLDFHHGIDHIEIRVLAATFAAVKSHAADVDGHLEITFGNDTLVVLGITKADLTAADVILA